MTDFQWERIFGALSHNILIRKGLGNEWEQITEDIKQFDISPSWREIIERELKPEQGEI